MSQNISNPPPVCCPVCGSREAVPVRKNYDAGLGCLGLLLFSWWGLLLGLLGGNDIEMYCQNCGYRWRPQGRGCLAGCLDVAAAIVAALMILFLILLFLVFLTGGV